MQERGICIKMYPLNSDVESALKQFGNNSKHIESEWGPIMSFEFVSWRLHFQVSNFVSTANLPKFEFRIWVLWFEIVTPRLSVRRRGKIHSSVSRIHTRLDTALGSDYIHTLNLNLNPELDLWIKLWTVGLTQNQVTMALWNLTKTVDLLYLIMCYTALTVPWSRLLAPRVWSGPEFVAFSESLFGV